MTIQIASAPVSWGIYEFDGLEPKFPYTKVLDEIAATGYSALELGPWGYLPTDLAVLRPELEKRSLQVLSSYVPVKLVDESAHEAGEAFALQVGRLLAALGAGYLVLADENCTDPTLTQQAGARSGTLLDDTQWEVVAKGVTRIARRVPSVEPSSTIMTSKGSPSGRRASRIWSTRGATLPRSLWAGVTTESTGSTRRG